MESDDPLERVRTLFESNRERSARWWVGRLWFLPVMVGSSAAITPELVRWVMELTLGGATIARGFSEAFDGFSSAGYVFCFAFRAVPYVLLAVPLTVLALTPARTYVLPMFVGGYTATTWFVVMGYWGTQRAFYTGEHISSTMAINYVIIPIFALIPMVMGAVAASLLFAAARFVMRLVSRRVPA